jgi:hypothetical protein
VDLADVDDALEAVERIKGSKNKAEYCASVGIDYHRVKAYHRQVMMLEQVFAVTRDPAAAPELTRPKHPPSVPTKRTPAMKPAMPVPKRPLPAKQQQRQQRAVSPAYLVFLLVCSLLSEREPT